MTRGHAIGCVNPDREAVPSEECASCVTLRERAERARLRYARETAEAAAARRETGRDPTNGWRAS